MFVSGEGVQQCHYQSQNYQFLSQFFQLIILAKPGPITITFSKVFERSVRPIVPPEPLIVALFCLCP